MDQRVKRADALVGPAPQKALKAPIGGTDLDGVGSPPPQFIGRKQSQIPFWKARRIERHPIADRPQHDIPESAMGSYIKQAHLHEEVANDVAGGIVNAIEARAPAGIGPKSLRQEPIDPGGRSVEHEGCWICRKLCVEILGGLRHLPNLHSGGREFCRDPNDCPNSVQQSVTYSGCGLRAPAAAEVFLYNGVASAKQNHSRLFEIQPPQFLKYWQRQLRHAARRDDGMKALHLQRYHDRHKRVAVFLRHVEAARPKDRHRPLVDKQLAGKEVHSTDNLVVAYTQYLDRFIITAAQRIRKEG
jgi:hypothetical protein